MKIYTVSKFIAVAVASALASLSVEAQRVPKFLLQIEPGFVFSKQRLDNDPDNDIKFAIISPSIYASKIVVPRGAVELGVNHASTFGEISSYSVTAAGLGVRYFLADAKIAQLKQQDISGFKKRFSTYGFIRKGIKIFESNSGNNPFSNKHDGWIGGLGSNIYFNPRFGVSFELTVAQARADLQRNLTFGLRTSLAFTHLEHWPAVRERPARNLESSTHSKLNKPPGGIAIEAGFGWAPQYSDPLPDGTYTWEHPLYYTLAGLVILPHNIEAGLAMTLIDAHGSVPEFSRRRDQYYLASIFSRYDVPLLSERVRIVAELSLNRSNYTYFLDSGHRRDNTNYFGFAPILRYAFTERVYCSGAMRFLLTLDQDRNTLAPNHPEIKITFLSSK